MASINTIDIEKARGSAGLDFLINKIDKLVTLPEVYYRLEAAIEDPASSSDDFSRLLSVDPDLCARLLRMANSAFYSFPARIETIDRAVSTIGLRQITELVLVTSVIEIFNNVPIEQVDMRSFWEHSVSVGVLSRAIAQFAGLPQSERYYIPGLLHDIGRLALYLKLPGMMGDLIQQVKLQEQSLTVLEMEQLGYSHANVGGYLLEHWKVPQSIYEPVNFHHEPLFAHEFTPISCAVNIADIWVNHKKRGSSGEAYEISMNTDALQLLGLQIYDLEEIWALAIDEIADVIRQFLNH
ncbi:MAG: HDOD domain-containing protein [Gammaproteobacteria bacterium]|nr:HDOD domain-containing protein [Gammaproteobacteria bacterium]